VSNKISERVSALRERANVFNSVMFDLQKMGPALRGDKNALAEWRQLMLDGNSIRAAIQTSGKMIDGASKWVSQTFQRKALDAIPFAADVVHTATNGSIGAIDHFLDRAKKAAQKFAPLALEFSKLDKKEQARLAALPVEKAKQSAAPALVLIAILGGLVFFSKKFGGDIPEVFEHDDDD